MYKPKIYQWKAQSVNETVTIDCPKHGKQRTYDIFAMYGARREVGVGCERCYVTLPNLKMGVEQMFY